MFLSSIKNNENVGGIVIHSKNVSCKLFLNKAGPLSSRSSFSSKEDQFHDQLSSLKGQKKSNGNAETVGTNPKTLTLNKNSNQISQSRKCTCSYNAQTSRIQCIYCHNQPTLTLIVPTSVNLLLSATSVLFLLLVSSAFNVFCILNGLGK